jgi:hypothetical protein
VSALSNYSILLDQLFERELFPRFEKARTLRESSVARKIGSLREAITTAVESTLNREKRGKPKASVDPSELESLLRVVTGEVGEQSASLDHTFRRLGDTADTVLETVARRASTWMHTSSESRLQPYNFRNGFMT